MAITAVFFDFIGTTLQENSKDVVVNCFRMAFADSGIDVQPAEIQKHRGKDKDEMIAIILRNARKDVHLRHEIFRSFKKLFSNHLHSFCESPGLEETIEHIRSKKAKVGVGTGLPREILQMLLEHFRWERFGFDYIATAQEIGKGRPNPDMIIDMMVKLHLNNFQFLKVGDTVADIQEGRNAHVMTVAMLSGTQPDSLLLNEKPDYAIRHLTELKQIV